MALYLLTNERYINGVYVYATLGLPQVVDLPGGTPSDAYLQPIPIPNANPPANDLINGSPPADFILP